MHFRVDVFFVCACFSVSSVVPPALTLEYYLTVVSCPRHLRWNTTKTDYSDTYSHIRPVLEELCKLCLMRSSCYHFNLSDICDSRDLNFLYACWMTIVVSWDRIYQKAFMQTVHQLILHEINRSKYTHSVNSKTGFRNMSNFSLTTVLYDWTKPRLMLSIDIYLLTVLGIGMPDKKVFRLSFKTKDNS